MAFLHIGKALILFLRLFLFFFGRISFVRCPSGVGYNATTSFYAETLDIECDLLGFIFTRGVELEAISKSDSAISGHSSLIKIFRKRFSSRNDRMVRRDFLGIPCRADKSLIGVFSHVLQFRDLG